MTVAEVPLVDNLETQPAARQVAVDPPRAEPLDYAIPGAETALHERRLVIDTPYESPFKRAVFFIAAAAVLILHVNFLDTYWGPGHYGNNQNAYLVGGKFLATRGTTGFEPKSPWEFVGWMWNMADENSTAAGGGWVYPKYPIGLPLLNATVYKVGLWFSEDGDISRAVDWTFKVSPICTSAAMFAIFLITRLVAGSFAGILAMISFATLTVVMWLSNNPYSHAADMGFVCCGMYALIKWWQRGGWWRGAIAGFLLGYAATIRYTEGLLVLPIAAAVICSMRWHRPAAWILAWSIFGACLIGAGALMMYAPDRQGWMAALAITAIVPIILMTVLMVVDGHGKMILRLSVPLLAWAVPLVALVTFNYITVGSPTGYDSTNESTGFTLTELQRKWRWGIDQFYNTGLYVLLPLSVGGMLMAFRWNWRLGLLLVLWYVPGTLLYLTYYWGMNLPVWGFLRFFASVLPAGVIAAVWLLQRAAASVDAPTAPISRQRAFYTGLAVVVAAAAVGSAAYFGFNKDGPYFGGFVALAAVAGALIAAGIGGAGRGVAGAIAMGVVIAFPAAINTDVSIGPLERDMVISNNMAAAGRNIRKAAPAGSVVFANSQRVCNFLQFAGDYELYGSDYFTGGRPVPGIRGGPNGEDPNPIQPARSKFTARVYEKFGREQRIAEARRICKEAIAAGRRVFVVNEVTSAGALSDTLAGDPDLIAESVANWTDPLKMTPTAIGSLGTIGGDGIARREQWKWRVIEIKLAPPKPAPAPKPTPPPATVPAVEEPKPAAPSTSPATKPA